MLGFEQRAPRAARTVLSNAKRVNTNPPRLAQGTAPDLFLLKMLVAALRTLNQSASPTPSSSSLTALLPLLPPKSCHYFLHLSSFLLTVSTHPSPPYFSPHHHHYHHLLLSSTPIIIFLLLFTPSVSRDIVIQ